MARVAVSQLLATDVALDKLGARGISAGETRQLLGNAHVVVGNPHEGGEPDSPRRLLIGLTDGRSALTS